MAHEVESMAYAAVRGLPWHGLGTGFQRGEITSWDAMRMAAGLMWDLEVTPLRAPSKSDPSVWTPVPGWKQIRRDDNGHPLYCSRESWTPITHAEMGDILAAMLDVKEDRLEFDTAGSLRGGEKVFATVAVGGEFFVGKDPSPHQRYIALLNAHDGTGACKVVETMVRVVCANTWHLADVSATQEGSVYAFNHTLNWRKRVEQARQALGLARKAHQETLAEMLPLLEIPFTPAQTEQLICALNPIPTELISERVRANIESARASMRHVISEANPALEGIYGTAYGAVQGVGEWLDHFRAARSRDTYTSRTLLAPEKGKYVARKLVLELAA